MNFQSISRCRLADVGRKQNFKSARSNVGLQLKVKEWRVRNALFWVRWQHMATYADTCTHTHTPTHTHTHTVGYVVSSVVTKRQSLTKS